MIDTCTLYTRYVRAGVVRCYFDLNQRTRGCILKKTAEKDLRYEIMSIRAPKFLAVCIINRVIYHDFYTTKKCLGLQAQ